jgi:hypothetical protein
MSARDCISRVQQAAGRNLTDDEVEAVFARIHKAALDIKAGRAQPGDVKMGAKLEKELAGKPGADDARTLIQKAAEKAAADLEQEAINAERTAHLQLVKMGARMKDKADMQAAGIKPLEAVQGTLTRDFTGKVKVESMEQRVMGWRTYLEAKLLPVWDSLGNDFFGFFQDRTKVVELIKALRQEPVLDPMAAKGADAYLKVADESLNAFNENGGHIGKLDNWAMPQHHGQYKVSNAGEFGKEPAKAQAKWVDDIFPLIDRTRYEDDLGAPRDDDWMREFLAKAWETIATNGHNKIEPGQFTGTGKRANRHAEHRQIHFKDAESVITYWEMYGEKTVVEILHGHIETMARDIAMVEHYGPNPTTTYKTLRDQALKDASLAEPINTPKFEGKVAQLDTLFDYVSGGAKPTFNRTMSAVADGLANLNVAGKLGGAVWASVFGDKPMMEAVSHLNHLPMLQRWKTELALLNPAAAADRRLLQQQGLMLDGVRSGLQRFYEGLGQSSFTGRVAGAVMKVSGMQAINDIRKGAFGASLMAQIGNMVERRVTYADLQQGDVRALKQYGITSHDWNVWSLAKPQDVGYGNRAITPEAISKITDQQLIAANVVAQAATPEQIQQARRDAIVKLLGVVNTESEFAVITPGWKERAAFYGELQRGTVKGELVRSMLQFKSFPWAALQRSIDAAQNADTKVGKFWMISWLLMSTTLAGAMIIQVREMLAGKDPRPMFPDKPYDRFKFWGAAFLQGGALGIYGDFLSSVNQSRYGTGPLEVMAGPTVGPLLSLALVQPMNAAAKTIEGKETHLAAQSIAQLKGFVPGNNLWYTKAATEHLVWQRVMESLSPGYLSKIQQRTRKEYGQDWWWRPGETAPERGPDLEKAFAP